MSQIVIYGGFKNQAHKSHCSSLLLHANVRNNKNISQNRQVMVIFWCRKCIKSHLRACTFQKISRGGVISLDPYHKGRDGEMVRWGVGGEVLLEPPPGNAGYATMYFIGYHLSI